MSRGKMIFYFVVSGLYAVALGTYGAGLMASDGDPASITNVLTMAALAGVIAVAYGIAIFQRKKILSG